MLMYVCTCLYESITSEAVVRRCSVRKDVLGSFTKFTGKHLCQRLFFNKVADPRPAALLKKKLWDRCFLVNFGEFLRTPFLTELLRWLLCNLQFVNPLNVKTMF